MNGDPYRNAPQPADRRVINRSGAAYRPADEPQPAREEPPVTAPRSSSAHRVKQPENEKKSRKGLLWTIIIAAVVIILGVGGWFYWSSTKNADTAIDSSLNQMVLLTSGQILFGKLSVLNDDSYKMTNVYYAQSNSASGDTTDSSATVSQNGIQLIHITDGNIKPKDEVIVMKKQVVYYENLQSDSKVTQLIQQSK